MSTEPPTDDTDERIVILNPVSGTGDHSEEVRERSRDHGYTVWETDEEGESIDLARQAADGGAGLVAAAGGDGTVNEVIRGIAAANALDRVTTGVIPCGTGNDFAENIGVTGIEDAFDVLERGDRRRIDIGFADDRPFVNSCVGGLTAEASAETSSELKSRLGTLAYVLTTLRTIPTFDGIRVSVDAFEEDGRTPIWSGEAIAVLIGNGRRFPPGGSTQADMEDGRFDVTLVHDTGSIDLVGNAAVERLLGRDTPGTTRYEAAAIGIEVREGDSIAFSLDGEIARRRRLSLRTDQGALGVAVGDGYDPAPEV